MNHLDDLVDESLDRLFPLQPEQGDWQDILTRLQTSPEAVPFIPTVRRRRFRWLLAPIAVLAAAAAALLISAPWRDGPSVIAKASAAISAGSPTDVLHEQAQMTLLVRRCPTSGPVILHCRKLRKPLRLPIESIALWVEGGTGHRSFRAIQRVHTPHRPNAKIEIPAGPFGNATATSTAQTQVVEIGGHLGPTHVADALVYQRYRNTLLRFTQKPTSISADAFDPIALVRHALATGQARVAGTAMLHGRPVRAITVQLHNLDAGSGTATYYVDPTTYAPVEIVFHHAPNLRFPYTPIFDPSVPIDIQVRFSTFRRMPATPATQALTDIRAQHKSAKIVCAVEFGLPDC
jgi:hypothetical protein